MDEWMDEWMDKWMTPPVRKLAFEFGAQVGRRVVCGRHHQRTTGAPA